MQYWRYNTGSDVSSSKIDSFLEEINEVCKKHGFGICHEDYQGSFIIEKHIEGSSYFGEHNTSIGSTVNVDDL